MGMAVSLMVAMVSPCPLRAADAFEVQLDGVVIPMSIEDLTDWGRSGGRSNTELGVWLDLLDPASRAGVLELLNAPLITDRSMARQMLNSWPGRRLLDGVADLVRVDNDTDGSTVFSTLDALLNSQATVSSLDLLEALPAQRVRLDLDALLDVAGHWRDQLQRQQRLVMALDQVRPQTVQSRSVGSEASSSRDPLRRALSVRHRDQPLDLQLWLPPSTPGHGTPGGNSDPPAWVVLMPGLGGTPDHFRWLGRLLSDHGWPVVVLDHPGSDSQAVGAWLEGRRLPPGAEVLPDRLQDLNAVLQAQADDRLPVRGEQVVLIGHSMGALTALLATGLQPQPGLERRCRQALEALPLANLSRLLQCQLTRVDLPRIVPAQPLAAVVTLNGFGSLLWPHRRPGRLPVPALYTGGTLDLITPPLDEQLHLLGTTASSEGSAVVLIEGASHFSPIRVEDAIVSGRDNDLFNLGEEFVGVQPREVQALLGDEILAFLKQRQPEDAVSSTREAPPHRHRQVGLLHVHRLTPAGAMALLDEL